MSGGRFLCRVETRHKKSTRFLIFGFMLGNWGTLGILCWVPIFMAEKRSNWGIPRFFMLVIFMLAPL